MLAQLQIYISKSENPYENLATEKHLLDTVPDDACTLYLWQNRNTVVIGKNQNPWAECNCSQLEKDGGFLARRLSGGGAVYHDTGNLNFTFLCKTEHYDLAKQLQVIRTACALAGIDTELSGRNDILADGSKFSGNAFYNSRGKSYHHGTILINADTTRMQRYLTPPQAKLAAKGVKSVRSRVVNLSELAPSLTCEKMKDYMYTAFLQVYNLPCRAHAEPDRESVDALAKQYASWDYLYGSTIPFSAEFESHFSWGHVQLLAQIDAGTITQAQIYTDAMDWQLADTATQALTGCRFEENALRAALLNALPEAQATDILSLFQK